MLMRVLNSVFNNIICTTVQDCQTSNTDVVHTNELLRMFGMTYKGTKKIVFLEQIRTWKGKGSNRVRKPPLFA